MWLQMRNSVFQPQNTVVNTKLAEISAVHMGLTEQAIREAAQEYPERVDGFDEEVEQLATLPDAFAEGSWRYEDIVWIAEWKTPRVRSKFQENDPAVVEDTIAEALAQPAVTQKLAVLTDLYGVGVPVASSILLFMNPTAYTVIDQFAWAVLAEHGHLEAELSRVPTAAEYLQYLGVCHALATEFNMELRRLDRGLWMLRTDGETPDS